MNGITNNDINFNRTPYTILKEYIINSNNKGYPLPYIEWNISLNILSYNEHMKTLLSITGDNKVKISDIIPQEYIQSFNEHLHELQNSKKHYSSFSYSSEIYGVSTNNTWLSALEENKVLSICCYTQTSTPLHDALSTLLEVIPTPTLILTPIGEYISCNTLMFKLLDIPNTSNKTITGNTLGTLGENISLCKYIKAAIGLAIPNAIREIQTTFNLNNGNKVYYLFSYCKHNNSIILIGLDITDVKILERDLLAAEERNSAILKVLPDVIKESSLRRKDDKIGTLIKQLTKDPIFTTIPQVYGSKIKESEEEESNDLLGDKDLYSKLIRLEVETREINVRLKQIETLMFLGDTSILNRLKHFEVTNETLHTKIGDTNDIIDKINKDIESIRFIQRVINMTPGGLSVFITYSLIILTLLIGGISYVLDSSGLKDTINYISNPFSILK